MSDKNKDLEQQEYMQKDVAFYQTFLTAWVENRMEVDKQLLTLSSLAVGLLMMFYDKLKDTTELTLWLIAGALFIATIILVLFVFRNNTKYIECLISNEDEEKKKAVEKKLQAQTVCAFWMFILAVISTFALAIIKSGFVITKIHGG
jgi:ABC-type multidrug transport system permease subunit